VMKRKVAVITGTRAEYRYLNYVMQRIEETPGLELIPVVTGMHLLKKFGYTFKEVKKDFPQSRKVNMVLRGDKNEAMGYYLASGIKNFTFFFSKSKPDIVLIVGDRNESLAAALAAFYLNIPVAHINGGEVTGTVIDESIRHAITKIAHIHFVATETNAERVRRMGEGKERIHVVGAPNVEFIQKEQSMSRKKIFEKYGLESGKKTLVVIHHPLTTFKDRGISQLRELLDALDDLRMQVIMIYPNCDAGSQQFIDIMEKYKKRSYLHIEKSLPYADFVNMLGNVDVLVGNSSCGIIEAPSLKLPVVNIGSRQQGRERSVNIVDVGAKKDEITGAIKYVLTDKNFRKTLKTCTNKYWKRGTSKKIALTLAKIKIDEKLIRKQITY